MNQKQQAASDKNEGLRFYGSLFSYLYCMLASTVLVQRPIFGGALYLSAQVAEMAARNILSGNSKCLGRGHRITINLLTGISFLLTFALLLIYPKMVDLPQIWLLFSLVFLLTLRTTFVRRICNSRLAKKMTKVQFSLRLAEAFLLLCAIAALILFFSLPTETAWYLLGGFMLAALLEGLSDSRPNKVADIPPPVEHAKPRKKKNAYFLFGTMQSIVASALQITMIFFYTFIGTTANRLLISLLIAFFCFVVSSRFSARMIGRKSRSDPSDILLFGLFLWLFSLIAFWQRSSNDHLLWSYTTIAACTAGTTITLSALNALDHSMRDVLSFVAQGEERKRAAATRAVSLEYADMTGRMIALIGLALLLFLSEKQIVLGSLQPALLLPALVLVATALLFAFRFPLSSKYIDKLHWFLMLEKNGETNVPLQKQLENVILNVSRKRYGIRILFMLLRPFFPVRVMGIENVKPEKGVSTVFVCNHGEVYGPAVTHLYVPFPFRPWVIAEMTDPQKTTDYIYEGTFKRQKWLFKKLRYPLAKLLTPLIIWASDSIDSIPVHRNNPRQLMNTFRLTVDAMEAGDNILLFPENPADVRLNTGFYLREGVGEFYTGFTMVAPLYHKRTGKCCLFVPLYADKKRHTLTFGEGIRYHPDNDPNPEKERLCRHLRNEILRMAEKNTVLPLDEDLS